MRAGSLTLSIVAAAAAAVSLSPVGHAQQTFTGGGAITVTSTQTMASSSTLAVSGAAGSEIGTVEVTINGLTTDGATGGLRDADIWLTAPGGQKLVLLGATGTGTDTLNGATITISDSASSAAPNGTAWTAGTFRPGSYWESVGLTPPYGTASNWPQSDGSATLTSVFNAAAPNGSWTLSIQNFNNVTTPISISSWSLVLAYIPQINTTTSLSTNAANNETTEGTEVTLTATVTAEETVNQGTVTFSDGGNDIFGCGSQAVSNGVAICDATFVTEGVHPLKATYNENTEYAGSTSPVVNLFVDHKTTNPSSGEYCNTGGLSIAGSLGGTNNPASPYPSHIDVTGYSGVISGATLTLNGFSDANPQQTVMALVGPTGTNLVPWNDVGGNTAVSNISFTLADSAGSSNTIASPPANGETYYSTADTGLGAAAFPAGTNPWGPPTTLLYAAPEGTQTLNGAFSGISPNGYWSLYLYNRTGSTAVSATGWCINLLSQPTMSVASSHTGSFTQGDTADTYTITVENDGPVSSSGELTLSDTLPAGMSAVSFAESGHGGGGTGSDWSCTGTSCTRTTAMPSGEQDTLTLTVSVGYNTATGTDAVTNSVTVSGGNASNSPTANDPTTINPGTVMVTFNTDPAGLTYSVNGTQYSTQQTLSIVNGTTVTIATTSPQTLAGTPYEWLSWSDGGSMSHLATISSMSGITTYTASFAPDGGPTVWITNGAGGLDELSDSGAAVSATPFTGGNGPVAIDVTGNLWTLSSGPTLLYVTNQLGTVQHSISSGGGLDAPSAIAIDGASQVWVTNAGNNTFSLFLDNGSAAASPSGGFTDGALSDPSGVAIDLGGSIWIANKGNNTVTRILGAAAPAAPLSTAAGNSTTGARP